MVNSTNQETSGFLTTVFDSFKSNVEERLRSPFAGAFLISWLVINWKPIYILFLSDKAVEFRVERVSEVFFSAANTLWWPLVASFVAIITFYFFSSVYLFIYECYGVVKTKIEMRFDKIRWVSPDAYVFAKQKNQDKYDALLKLATDNTKIMDEARVRAEEAETKYAELQLNYADNQLKYQQQQLNNEKNHKIIKQNMETIADFEKKNSALNTLLDEKKKKNSVLSDELIQVNALIKEVLAQMESAYSKEVSKTLSLDSYTEAMKNNMDDESKRKNLPVLTGGHLAQLFEGGHTMDNGRRLVEKLKLHINKQ